MAQDPVPGSARRAVVLAVAGTVVVGCSVADATGWVAWPVLGLWLAAHAALIASLLVGVGLLAASGWSRLAHRWVRGGGRPRPALSWWVVAAAGFVVVVVAWGATSLLLDEAGQAKDVAATRVDAIKTGLGIAAGTGGVFALLLAVRRQWHQEMAAANTALDASERRVTELYTRAADQLGSDKAPVRLAGLYALERLAQANPGQRQTVVNVLCAYLRMPYQPPDSDTRTVPTGPGRADTKRGDAPAPPSDSATPTSKSGGETAMDAAPEDASGGVQSAAASERERRLQEREVRLAAQAILTAHLKPGDQPDRPVETFWPGLDINLFGALLINFDARRSRIRAANFVEAFFAGYAGFAQATFTGDAWFNRATFTGDAWLHGTTFIGDAWLHGAIFTRDTRFDGATFIGDAGFSGSTFTGDATFEGVRFAGDTRFDRTNFLGGSRFTGTTFARDVWFHGTTFAERAAFDAVSFTRDADFREVTLPKGTLFSGTTFAGNALFSEATFAREPYELVGARWRVNTQVSLPPGLDWEPDDSDGFRRVRLADSVDAAEPDISPESPSASPPS